MFRYVLPKDADTAACDRQLVNITTGGVFVYEICEQFSTGGKYDAEYKCYSNLFGAANLQQKIEAYFATDSIAPLKDAICNACGGQ